MAQLIHCRESRIFDSVAGSSRPLDDHRDAVSERALPYASTDVCPIATAMENAAKNLYLVPPEVNRTECGSSNAF